MLGRPKKIFNLNAPAAIKVPETSLKLRMFAEIFRADLALGGYYHASADWSNKVFIR